MKRSHLLPLLVLVAACGDDAAPTTTGDPVLDMRAEIERMEAAPEQPATEVEVLHVLVGYDKAPRLNNVTRTLEEAERLTADLLVRARGGEDFETLMQQFSDDTGGGQYALTATREAAVGQTADGVRRYYRGDMQPNFGEVAWKLPVGEIGVAPQHPLRSVYGWHIVKRTR